MGLHARKERSDDRPMPGLNRSSDLIQMYFKGSTGMEVSYDRKFRSSVDGKAMTSVNDIHCTFNIH